MTGQFFLRDDAIFAGVPGQARVSVADFGAPGDGTDQTAAILNAIAALPSSGGTVFFPAGLYIISSSLIIGNGSSAAWSTINGIILEGEGSPQGAFNDGSTSSTTIRWGGASGGFNSIIIVAGPLHGWGVKNLCLDGNNIDTIIGLRVTSAGYGRAENLNIIGVWTGIREDTLPQGSLTGVINTTHNVFDTISINVFDQSGGQFCIFITGDGTDAAPNTCFEVYRNIMLSANGNSNGTTGIYLGTCDSCDFYDVHMAFAGGTIVPLNFDYTVAGPPASCKFFGIDPSGAEHANSIATGTGPSADNAIYALRTTNGATETPISGVSYIDAGGTGTVTSVDMTVPAGLAVSGNPISTSGTLALTWSGAIPAAQLPNPSASTLGGVQSLAAVASKWINAISTSGVPSATQPAITDLLQTTAFTTFSNTSVHDVLGSGTVSGSVSGGYFKIGPLIIVFFECLATDTAGGAGGAVPAFTLPVNGGSTFQALFPNQISSGSGIIGLGAWSDDVFNEGITTYFNGPPDGALPLGYGFPDASQHIITGYLVYATV